MDCPVCYEEMDNSKLSCGHKVHGNCIIKSGIAKCPICRSELPQYKDLVVPLDIDDPDWRILDRLILSGILKYNDLPIIDSLDIPIDDELMIVKASILLYACRSLLE